MKILIILVAGVILTHAQDSPSNLIKTPCNTLVVPVCPQNQYFDYNLCQCVCASSKNCLYPGQLNAQSCICDCPWWSYLLCQKNQFLNPKNCQCECKEPCKDCSRPQIWNENVCNCVCPYRKKCLKNQFWSEWSCNCECKQKPRKCCEKKIWSQKVCDCTCQYPVSCVYGSEWDSFSCKCMKTYLWWQWEQEQKITEDPLIPFIDQANQMAEEIQNFMDSLASQNVDRVCLENVLRAAETTKQSADLTSQNFRELATIKNPIELVDSVRSSIDEVKALLAACPGLTTTSDFTTTESSAIENFIANLKSLISSVDSSNTCYDGYISSLKNILSQINEYLQNLSSTSEINLDFYEFMLAEMGVSYDHVCRIYIPYKQTLTSQLQRLDEFLAYIQDFFNIYGDLICLNEILANLNEAKRETLGRISDFKTFPPMIPDPQGIVDSIVSHVDQVTNHATIDGCINSITTFTTETTIDPYLLLLQNLTDQYSNLRTIYYVISGEGLKCYDPILPDLYQQFGALEAAQSVIASWPLIDAQSVVDEASKITEMILQIYEECRASTTTSTQVTTTETTTETTTIDPYVILDQTLSDQQPLLDNMRTILQNRLSDPNIQANQVLVDCYTESMNLIDGVKGLVTDTQGSLRTLDLTSANSSVDEMLLLVDSVTDPAKLTDCENLASTTESYTR